MDEGTSGFPPMEIDAPSKDQHIPNEKNSKYFQTTPVQNTKSSDQLGLSLSYISTAKLPCRVGQESRD